MNYGGNCDEEMVDGCVRYDDGDRGYGYLCVDDIYYDRESWGDVDDTCTTLARSGSFGGTRAYCLGMLP